MRTKSITTRTPLHPGCVLLLCGLIFAMPQPILAQASAPGSSGDDTRPLSPAQIALFETAHLQNVGRPETLQYRYRRIGPAGFDDTVSIRIRSIHDDGTKELSFDYLTGPHRVLFPNLDHFRGNPLLMLVLDRDVASMKDALGVSANYFRNRVRESFVDAATVVPATAELDGRTVPARKITVQPFTHEARLERIASVQAKIYTFVLSEEVPGMIAEIRIDTPADVALQAPALSEQITFERVAP